MWCFLKVIEYLWSLQRIGRQMMCGGRPYEELVMEDNSNT